MIKKLSRSFQEAPLLNRSSIASIVALVFLFWGLSGLSKFLRLTKDAYAGPVILLGAFKNPAFVLFMIYTAGLIIAQKVDLKRFDLRGRLSWKSFEHGYLRVLIVTVTVVIAYAFSFYSYNFYYDQLHLLDRLLVIGLAVGVYFSPIFVVPFIAFAMVVIAQFSYPGVLVYSYTDKQLLLNILLLFSTYLFLRAVFKVKGQIFTFTLFAMMASFYVAPGYKKVTVGPHLWSWMLSNNIGHLFMGSHLNGWLDFIDMNTAVQIFQFLTAFAVFAQVMTVIIELGPIFLIASRRVAIVMLLGGALLHTMIFIFSGTFFWKWIIVDITLALLLHYNRGKPVLTTLFRPAHLAIFIPLVLLSPLYFGPHFLGWFDSTLTNFYSFQVTTVDDQTYNFPPGYFEPYDLPFAQNRFYYLSDVPVLSGAFGTETDYSDWAGLIGIQGPDDLDSIRTEFGHLEYDSDRSQAFYSFLQTWFTNYNRHVLSDPELLLDPGPPHHVTVFEVDNPYKENAQIREVDVIYHEIYYAGGHVIPVTDELIHSIDIPEQ